MPFIPLSRTTLRDWVHVPAIRVYAVEGARNGDRRLTFALSNLLLGQLGWQPADRLVTAIGTGPDSGTWRISRGDARGEGQRLTPFGKYASRVHVVVPAIAFGVDTAPLFKDRSFPLIAEHRLTEDRRAILFTLPAAISDTRIVSLKHRKARK